jgi:dihydrofolate synthase / folylpolyglutamate synthase
MTYPQAVAYLFSLQFFGIKMGLQTVARLCEELGNPQNDFESIHTAGTNGKGSTCAMIEATLRRAGYKTGLYTSPHFIDFSERIQIGGKTIDPEFVCWFTQKIKPLADSLHATFFEVTTSLAYSYFSKEKVEFAVMETGMGGRLDATNILKPLLCVITPIALDHMQYLGSTLEQIAGEKAGIVKERTPVVLAEMDAVAKQVCLLKAQELHSPVLFANSFLPVERIEQAENGYNVFARLECRPFSFFLPLCGKHQIGNAQTAITALVQLKKMGYPISDEMISQGISKTRWPGRFEIVKKDPAMVLDVSHNPQGAQTLVSTFQSFFPGKRPLFVIGMMADKDYAAFLEALKPLKGRFIVTKPGTARAAETNEMASKIPFAPVEQIPEVAKAVEKALKTANPNEVIVVTGSFYTAGEAMTCLNINPCV